MGFVPLEDLRVSPLCGAESRALSLVEGMLRVTVQFSGGTRALWCAGTERLGDLPQGILCVQRLSHDRKVLFSKQQTWKRGHTKINLLQKLKPSLSSDPSSQRRHCDGCGVWHPI